LEAPIDEDNHGVFFLNRSLCYEDISDGTAHTLFIGEKYYASPDNARQDLGWMSGTRWTLRNTGSLVNAWRVAARSQAAQSRQLGQGGADRGSGMDLGGGVMAETEASTQPEEAGQQLAGALPVGGFASTHPGGANFAFGDGHVAFVNESMTLEVLQQLGHRADGKLLMRTER
jgi:prepilin-type processing-associated H-X9-DG protein